MSRLRKLHQNKHRKLNRRRLLEIFAAAGVASTTATAVTPEDIQSADSDEVPVSLDLDGDHKWNVPLDWYERLLDAREVLEKNKQLPIERDGVISIEMNPGDLGGENPYLAVDIDEDKEVNINSRDLQGQNRDVRIVFNKISNPEMTKEGDSPGSDVNSDPCGDLTTTGDIPGGLEVVFGNARGTLTSRVSGPNFNEGWLTNTHVASSTSGDCGSDLIGAEAEHGGEKIGEVVAVDHDHDFVVIEPTEGRSPESKVVLPSDHDTEYDIQGTMSKDGFDTFSAEGWDVKKIGTTTCESSGTPHARGKPVTVKANDNCKSIGELYWDQVTWGSAINDIRPGDSGSLTFGSYPDSSNYLGMCINISVTGTNRVHGTPGWIVDNSEDYQWSS